MKALFFDLETTGTMYWKNGIHQISGYVEIDDSLKETFDFKVQPNPRAVINPDALVVCNVKEEQILNYPPMGTVYKAFTAMLNKYIDRYNKQDKFYLIGYNNSSFDNHFLKAWFVQNSDDYFYSYFWSSSIDVMVLAAEHLRLQRPYMKDFKLKTVAETMGITVEESRLHDATYDIELTRNIYKILTKQLYAVR